MALRAVIAALLGVLLLPAPAPAAGSWSWPVRGDVLTPFRNGSDPYAAGQHRGIDIGAPEGTDVVAAVSGTVRHAGVAGDSGLTVSVRAGGYDVSYLHLSAVAVKEGQEVAAGTRLGAVGTSGRRSVTAPHLHFGVRRAGDRHAYLDPLDFLAPPPSSPREAPRGAPAPAPVPVVPNLQPVPVRGPAPRRVPAGRPVRVPAGRRVRVPAGRRVRAPRLGPAPRGLAPRTVPGGGRVPALRPVPAVRSGPRPVPAPRSGPRPVRLGEPRRARSPRPAQVPEPAGPVAAGPDLGWALACLGLLAAAACLGRPGRGEDGAGGRRPAGLAAQLRALVRPLVGGRR